jgi:hypothetical protein
MAKRKVVSKSNNATQVKPHWTFAIVSEVCLGMHRAHGRSVLSPETVGDPNATRLALRATNGSGRTGIAGSSAQLEPGPRRPTLPGPTRKCTAVDRGAPGAPAPAPHTAGTTAEGGPPEQAAASGPEGSDVNSARYTRALRDLDSSDMSELKEPMPRTSLSEKLHHFPALLHSA